MRATLLLLVAVVALSGCGGGQSEEARIKQITESGGTVEILVEAHRLTNVKKLKALLPKNVPGMKLVEADAKKTGSIGRKVAHAAAAYEGSDGQFFQVSIIDLGGSKGFGAHSDFAWCTNNVREDSDTHIALVSSIDGRRSYEEYDSNSRSGKVRVLIANRFIVEIDGSSMEFPDIKALLKIMPIQELEALAK